jgi:hypothetical protein
MNHLPEPPEDPQLVIAQGNIPRYGIVLDRYVRKIIDGPLLLRGSSNSYPLYHYFEKENGDTVIYTNFDVQRKIIEWDDDMHIGMFDPNYGPVRTEGKYYPGLKVKTLFNYFNETIKLTIIDGPFYTLDIVNKLKVYICKRTDSEDEQYYLYPESGLEEIPENLAKRLHKANAYRKAAYRQPRLKNTMKQKLSAITVPVTETRRNMRRRWFNMAGPKPTRDIELPNNITRHISEYLFGNDKYSRNLKQYYDARAKTLSATKPPRPDAILLGGKRRTRRSRG